MKEGLTFTKLAVYNTSLIPSGREKVVQLIGEKHVNSKMNDIQKKVLLETGTQVSLVPNNYLIKDLPNVETIKIEESSASTMGESDRDTLSRMGWADISYKIKQLRF